MSEIAAQRGLKVAAIDLDEQRNLSETLKFTSSNFPNIDIRTSFNQQIANEDYDFYVLDTHPTKGGTIVEALEFADIILIPILGDFLSVLNLRSAIDYVMTLDVEAWRVAIVKNCMTGLKVSEEVENLLNRNAYSIAGRLPRNNILIKNIASGESWDKFMRPYQREPFMQLYRQLWSVNKKIAVGNVNNLWGERD